MGRIDFAATALAVSLAATLVGDCSPTEPPPAVTETRHETAADAIVLVTIDGVRWQEIFDGVDPRLAADAKMPPVPDRSARALLPNMHRLFFEEGTVVGDPRRAGGIEGSARRHMSMPGYVEISTGASTECVDNDCMPVLGETLADAVTASPGGSAAVFGSWSEIARAAAARPERLFVQAGHAPGQTGRPLGGGTTYLHDQVTAEQALDHLRTRKPRFLWVALGDTDEWAHAGDYRGYVEALRAADRFLDDLVATLGRMGERGARTAIFVTADHGRDPGFNHHGGPESARVWLLARGPSIAPRGLIGTTRAHALRDLAPTLRAHLGLPARACPTCGEPIEELLPERSDTRAASLTTAR
ncbi:MAG: alkaline phosphatase family protein [Minicystis sp.]